MLAPIDFQVAAKLQTIIPLIFYLHDRVRLLRAAVTTVNEQATTIVIHPDDLQLELSSDPETEVIELLAQLNQQADVLAFLNAYLAGKQQTLKDIIIRVRAQTGVAITLDTDYARVFSELLTAELTFYIKQYFADSPRESHALDRTVVAAEHTWRKVRRGVRHTVMPQDGSQSILYKLLAEYNALRVKAWMFATLEMGAAQSVSRAYQQYVLKVEDFATILANKVLGELLWHKVSHEHADNRPHLVRNAGKLKHEVKDEIEHEIADKRLLLARILTELLRQSITTNRSGGLAQEGDETDFLHRLFVYVCRLARVSETSAVVAAVTWPTLLTAVQPDDVVIDIFTDNKRASQERKSVAISTDTLDDEIAKVLRNILSFQFYFEDSRRLWGDICHQFNRQVSRETLTDTDLLLPSMNEIADVNDLLACLQQSTDELPTKLSRLQDFHRRQVARLTQWTAAVKDTTATDFVSGADTATHVAAVITALAAHHIEQHSPREKKRGSFSARLSQRGDSGFRRIKRGSQHLLEAEDNVRTMQAKRFAEYNTERVNQWMLQTFSKVSQPRPVQKEYNGGLAGYYDEVLRPSFSDLLWAKVTRDDKTKQQVKTDTGQALPSIQQSLATARQALTDQIVAQQAGVRMLVDGTEGGDALFTLACTLRLHVKDRSSSSSDEPLPVISADATSGSDEDVSDITSPRTPSATPFWHRAHPVDQPPKRPPPVAPSVTSSPPRGAFAASAGSS